MGRLMMRMNMMSLSEKVLFSSQGSHSYMNTWKWFKAKRARTLPSEIP